RAFGQDVIAGKYAPQLRTLGANIAAAQSKLDRAGRAVTVAETKLAAAEHQLQCELHGVRAGAGCLGTTGQAGDGDRAAIRRDSRDAAQIQLGRAHTELEAAQRQWAPRLADWQRQRVRLSAAEAQESARATAHYHAVDGLAARRRALEEIASS